MGILAFHITCSLEKEHLSLFLMFNYLLLIIYFISSPLTKLCFVTVSMFIGYL